MMGFLPEEFLKFHNECFDDKKVALTAAAEEYSDEEEEYKEALLESVKKSKIWLDQTVNRTDQIQV